MLFWTIMATIIFGLIGLGVYVYYHRQGQFDDPESVKYQLFREDNPDN